MTRVSCARTSTLQVNVSGKGEKRRKTKVSQALAAGNRSHGIKCKVFGVKIENGEWVPSQDATVGTRSKRE